MRKVNLIILALICTTFNYAAQAQNISQTDSLERIIQSTSTEDTTRLAAIRELARIEQNTDKGLEIARELLHEAERLNVNRYIAFGAYYASIYYLNRQELDSAVHYANIILPIAEKEKIWVIYFDALKFRTLAYYLEENFELAIDEGQQMLIKAKSINYPDGIVLANIVLATSYLGTERWEEGLQHLQEAHKYSAQINNRLVSIEVLSMLTIASFHLADYDALYQYINEFKNSLADYTRKSPFVESLNNQYAFIEIYSAYYYLRTNQPNEALPHLAEAKKLLDNDGFILYQLLYHDAMAEYFYSQKQFDKVIIEIDLTLPILQEMVLNDYYKQIVKKADVYIEMGEYLKAIPLYQESIAGKDSLSRIISNKQLKQIQEIYNINRLGFEKERLNIERQIIILLLIIFVMIILTAFIIRIVFVKRRLKQSEKLIRKASETASEANIVKERFLSNISYNIRTPLNSVVGFSQLLSVEPGMEEEQRKEYSLIIQRNSEELMNLVNNILDLSRLESGMMKFNISTGTITSLCNDAIYTANRQNNEFISIATDIRNPESEIRTDFSRFISLLASTLIYPTNWKQERKLSLHVDTSTDGKEFFFEISNSPLSDPTYATQEVAVQNEINRLFIEHFGGTYRIHSENSLPGRIVFTYPLSISQ